MLGIATISAGNYSSAASATKKPETNAKRLAKASKACKKKHSMAKRKKCEAAAKKQYEVAPQDTTTGAGTTGTTTGTPEELSATLIVEVESCGGPKGECHSLEGQPLRITRLGPTTKTWVASKP